MKRIFVVAVLWACALVAAAAGPAAVRKQVESRMLVTGKITIEADGRVNGFELDQREKLPDPVAGLVERSVPLWRFDPMRVEGKPVKTQARMSMGIVAKKQQDDQFLLDIRNAGFVVENQDPAKEISGKAMRPPSYPEAAYRMGVKGTVYLILRLTPQGTVAEAFTEQVNLTVVGDERVMARGRDLLSRSALQAAKAWTFNVPANAADDEDPFWMVRVPVAYAWADDRTPQYGEWESYVPGPTQKAPWILEEIDASYSPDTQVAGSVQEVGDAPRLLSKLEPE